MLLYFDLNCWLLLCLARHPANCSTALSKVFSRDLQVYQCIRAHKLTQNSAQVHVSCKLMAYSGMYALVVLQTLDWHIIIIKVGLKRFSFPQLGDSFLGGVCMNYNMVHTICIRTVLGFLGVCKISFVSHLILPSKILFSTSHSPHTSCCITCCCSYAMKVAITVIRKTKKGVTFNTIKILWP